MICKDSIDPVALLAEFTVSNGDAGAIVSFIGTVRATDGVIALELEHHPTFSACTIAAIGSDARERFGLLDSLIAHRVGSLAPGEPIVFVAAASAHRRSAFDAVDYMMDRLKTEAPLWKREVRDNCTDWIVARASDAADRARWDEDEHADR